MLTETGTTTTFTQAPIGASATRLSLTTQRALLACALVVTDAVALTAAFATAFWVRFDLQLTLAPEVVPPSSVYKDLSAVLIPVWLLVFGLYNLYDRQARLGGIQESSRTFNACTTATMLVIVGTFLFPDVRRLADVGGLRVAAVLPVRGSRPVRCQTSGLRPADARLLPCRRPSSWAPTGKR